MSNGSDGVGVLQPPWNFNGSSVNQSADLFANISCNMATNDSTSCSPVDDGEGTGSPYKALEMFFIALVTGSLSFVTVTGNILVMLSIKFIVGQRTVPPGECYIQFLSNPAVTFGTAIAAFYLPVIIMTVLYIHISLASRSRVSKHKPEKKEKKGIKTPSLIKSHLLKQNNNNETSPQASPHSAPKLSLDSTTTALEAVKNGRVEAPKPVQPQPLTQPSPGLTQEKESSNDSSTAFIPPTEPKGNTNKEVISEAATNPKTVSTATANPAEPKINSTSKWSKIKIVTKQTGDECITAIEIVPPVEGAERHSIPISRPRTVARKFASIARSQVKRKRQMAAREKKVC
ncbi:Muscarinic acetylcholine receptor M4 [Larimichthys crocea]|uniref:Muscarinic acetylcholine receptor M4 n=1 Tax=Larimichthys crocea TaxID=215358 RepID=A0A6G0HI34_LARCR|nr:Muscarinic acetylcholine receptor M4 [Larimichthys crocea]